MADQSRFEYTSIKGNKVRLIGIENVNLTTDMRRNKWMYSVKNIETNEIVSLEKSAFFAAVIPNEYDRANKL
jgi:hypothetical protein